MADTPAGGGRADGRTLRRVVDRVGAILRMGIHAYAMGVGRMRREPQREGREDVSTWTSDQQRDLNSASRLRLNMLVYYTPSSTCPPHVARCVPCALYVLSLYTVL
jgi:hypothetical protein